MFDFTKKKTGILKSKYRPSLIIDGDILEYTFIKKRAKTSTEFKTDVILKKNLAKPVSTIVSVYMDLNDLHFVDYDKDNNHIFMVGKFSVSYRSADYEYESSVEYKDKLYGIEFLYDFVDINQFLKILSIHTKTTKLLEKVEPISLWKIVQL